MSTYSTNPKSLVILLVNLHVIENIWELIYM